MLYSHALSRPTTYTYQLKHVKTTLWRMIPRDSPCFLWFFVWSFASSNSLRGTTVEPRQQPQTMQDRNSPQKPFHLPRAHACTILLERMHIVGSRNFPIRQFKLHNRTLDTFKAQDRWWRGCARSTVPDFLNRLSWINKKHKQCNMKWMQPCLLPWTGKPTSATSHFY